ncbi:hypothetical protein VTH06DRAFT_2982 [Thermothelomyces fergusii]
MCALLRSLTTPHANKGTTKCLVKQGLKASIAIAPIFPLYLVLTIDLHVGFPLFFCLLPLGISPAHAIVVTRPRAGYLGPSHYNRHRSQPAKMLAKRWPRY